MSDKKKIKFTPQVFYDKVRKRKEKIKELTEEVSELTDKFVNKFGMEKEYPIDVEGKTKYVRVEEPKGQFVYNRKHEVGLRAKPINPVETEEK